MNRAKSLLLLGLALVTSLLFGCSTPAVGAPCLPEQVPEDGFQDSEAYVESSSVQCETRTCIVFRLRGDPREGCMQVDPDPSDPTSTGRFCANQQPSRSACNAVPRHSPTRALRVRVPDGSPASRARAGRAVCAAVTGPNGTFTGS